MARWFTGLLLSLAMVSAHAARPVLVRNAAADSVVEHLPRGYSDLEPRGGTLGGGANLATVEKLLSVSQRTGDARLASRAEALWLALPAQVRATTRALEVYSFIVQHRHDFAGSLKILDRVLRAEHYNADAILARAQINLVLGRLREARGDCGQLALGIDVPSALVCVAAFSERTGEYAQARSLVERWLAEPSSNPSYRRYMLITRGEIAARSGESDPDTWFRQALALDPEDVRSLAAYARYLNHAHRFADTRTLLATAPRTDALQLQESLAALALKSSDSADLTRRLAARYALAHELGTVPEMRDEAELLLATGKTAAALALAERNFETQRDYEDVDVLQRAAQAAKSPDALKRVDDWARGESLDLRKAGGKP